MVFALNIAELYTNTGILSSHGDVAMGTPEASVSHKQYCTIFSCKRKCDLFPSILTCYRCLTVYLFHRPYLYDEGDPYDKPFYGTLLKMLSEVAT